MFNGCTGLKVIKCYAETLGYQSTQNWVQGVTNTIAWDGIFVYANGKSSLWTSGNNGYPSNWTKIEKSKYEYVHKYELGTVAFTNNYNSLTNRPTIPSTTGMVTSSTDNLKIESTNSVPAGAQATALYFDSTTNTLYFV